MVIVKLIGGLGNQLFQYALGKQISFKLNQPLYLDIDHFAHDIRGFELEVFNISAQIASRKERCWYQRVPQSKFLAKIWYPIQRIVKKCDPSYIIENPLHPKVHRGMYDFQSRILKLNKPYLYLEGFRQSEMYFKDIAELIRKDFTLKTPISDKDNLSALEKIKGSTSVSLHVRRSDYIGSHYAGICDVAYYDRAIAYINKTIPNATFFIFSDDIQWCIENIRIPNEHHYIDRNSGKNSYKDMILMSHCMHNIIANSTFSRWGARLNSNKNKIVIAPTNWHGNLDYKDIIPDQWIRL